MCHSERSEEPPPSCRRGGFLAALGMTPQYTAAGDTRLRRSGNEEYRIPNSEFRIKNWPLTLNSSFLIRYSQFFVLPMPVCLTFEAHAYAAAGGTQLTRSGNEEYRIPNSEFRIKNWPFILNSSF